MQIWCGVGEVVCEKDFMLVEVYVVDEVFVIGILGGIIFVMQIDGCRIGNGMFGLVGVEFVVLYQDFIEKV